MRHQRNKIEDTQTEIRALISKTKMKEIEMERV